MLMKTDDLGVPRFTNHDLINMIYSGNIEKCHVVLCEPSDDITKFNAAMEEQGLPPLTKYIPIDVDKKEFDAACQSEWFMPDEYKNMSDHALWHILISRCTNEKESDRVMEEYDAYQQRDMLNLLKYMLYLVEFMREHNIVWGVGRGSSVASYILFLIGVHKIDSLRFNLQWEEFLR